MKHAHHLRPGLSVVLVAAALLLTSCAYYNTFYLARRNYDRGLMDLPYAVDKTDIVPGAQFSKAIDYSRKVIEQYPKSKWVDDAYLLWARTLIANDDPRQAIKMLEDFDARFPRSQVRDEATFYLGVACRQARKNERALHVFDEFVARAPHHKLVPYAQLERSRALMALDRPEEAAQAASIVVEHHRKSRIAVRARVARAEALLAQKAYDRAREDYRFLGAHAVTDDERLDFLMHEAECLEVGRQFDQALGLLKDALAHERAPVLSDTSGGRPLTVLAGEGSDRYGRLLTRIGTVHLRAGHTEEALAAYRNVLSHYPRTALGAEAQYRIGYAYETELDDFEHARDEYAKVREQGGGTSFADQAAQRAASLERLIKFRQSGGDSLDRKAEAAFLLAEQYLFELDKPERALEEYRKIENDFAGTSFAAKALNAQAWTLSRKLKRQAEADTLFWKVVREHAGTEAQLAARDYLEFEGVEVPSELIKLPEPALARADTTPVLTEPPQGPMLLGAPLTGLPTDSLRIGPHPSPIALPRVVTPPGVGPAPPMASAPPAAAPPGIPARPGVSSTSVWPDSGLAGPGAPPGAPRSGAGAAPDSAHAQHPASAPATPPAPAPADTSGTPAPAGTPETPE